LNPLQIEITMRRITYPLAQPFVTELLRRGISTAPASKHIRCSGDAKRLFNQKSKQLGQRSIYPYGFARKERILWRNTQVASFSNGSSSNNNHRDDEGNSLSSRNAGRMAGIGGAVAMLWGKTKWIIGALKFTKFSSVISMAATTGAYSIFFGFPFAAGMVGQIALHEAGHALAMLRCNIPFTPAVFIPFMGATIGMKERPKNVSDDIFISIAGPVMGGVTAMGISAVGISTDSQLLIALADFGYMINLFNLLPIGQLDGGHIAGGLNRWTLVGGLGIGGAMIYNGLINNPIFYLVMLSGVFSTWSRFFGTAELPASYYRMGNGQRAFWTFSYFGLIALLTVAMQINNKHKKSIRQLREETNEVVEDKNSLGYKFEKYADSWGEDDPYITGKATGSQMPGDEQFLKDYFGSYSDDASTEL